MPLQLMKWIKISDQLPLRYTDILLTNGVDVHPAYICSMPNETNPEEIEVEIDDEDFTLD